jgi:chromosome segregation ATPase
MQTVTATNNQKVEKQNAPREATRSQGFIDELEKLKQKLESSQKEKEELAAQVENLKSVLSTTSVAWQEAKNHAEYIEKEAVKDRGTLKALERKVANDAVSAQRVSESWQSKLAKTEVSWQSRYDKLEEKRKELAARAFAAEQSLRSIPEAEPLSFEAVVGYCSTLSTEQVAELRNALSARVKELKE